MLRMISILVVLMIAVFGNAINILAQQYPSHPVNLIIPMAPGDGVDVAGRLMAEELTKLLKVPVATQNKPGATGTVGTDAVIKANKDGYTILFTNSASVIYTKILNPENVPYDAFKDLTPLGLTTISPVLLTVRPDAPYKDFREFVEYAKKNPGKIRCGIPGVGSVSEFNVEIIKNLTGVDITVIPFKGAMPAVTALLGGHVEAIAAAMGPLSSHIRGGKMKGLVISNTFPEFPDIPTLKQMGHKQDLLGVWFAFFAPAGLAPQVTETLVLAIEKAAKDPGISGKLAQMGNIQEFDPPEKVSTRMREEYKMVEEIAKKTGMLK